jgi:uncharacterized membrane protein
MNDLRRTVERRMPDLSRLGRTAGRGGTDLIDRIRTTVGLSPRRNPMERAIDALAGGLSAGGSGLLDALGGLGDGISDAGQAIADRASGLPGPFRRRSRFEAAVDQVRSVLGDAGSTLGEATGTIRPRSAGAELADRARDGLGGGIDRLAGLAPAVAARSAVAGGWERIQSSKAPLDQLEDELPELKQGDALVVVRRKRGPGAGSLAVPLFGAAAGATAVYLLDPQHGPRRRARLRDQVVSFQHRLPRILDATVDDARNRVQGLVAGFRQGMSDEQPDDVVLVERVRSQLGRLVTHPGAITATADGGRVTLTGLVRRSEHDGLLEGINQVKGVAGIEDRLDVRDRVDDIPSFQGDPSARRDRRATARDRWMPAPRAAAMAAGTTLVGIGLVRRGLLGTAAAAGGALLALRAGLNMPLTRALGLADEREGIDAHHAIEVGASPEAVWSVVEHREAWPKFMSHVQDVRIDPDTDHETWTVDGPAGSAITVEEVLTEVQPGRLIAWKSVDTEPIGEQGVMRLVPVAENRTRVDVQMTYNPPAGVVGHAVATIFGVDPASSLRDDLMRLKSLVEHGKATGDSSSARLEDVAPEASSGSRMPGQDLGADRLSGAGDLGLETGDAGIEPAEPMDAGAGDPFAGGAIVFEETIVLEDVVTGEPGMGETPTTAEPGIGPLGAEAPEDDASR